MALNLSQLTQMCLAYFDLQAIGEATFPQKQAVANAINGALQEIWQNGPPHFKRRELSDILHGPTAVTFTVTQGSKVVSGFTGWQSWMAGCTVRIDGDQYDNEFVDGGTLLQPFQGASGLRNANVFGDCVNLAPEVSSVLGCVRLADIRELVPAPNREAFNRANYWHEGDYGEVILSVQVRRKWTGQPHTYWVDTVYTPGSENNPPTQPTIRLRVSPIPQQQFVIKWDAEINPPVVTVNSLDDDGVVFELPGANTELILVPYVLQRLIAAPWWKNKDAIPEIGRQMKGAEAALYGSRPQVKRARRLTPVI